MIINAFAKINLTLDIVGRRQDGYHNIDSVFQSVGLFDTLKIEKSDKISVYCEGIENENNIAYTAAKEFFKYTKISGGANIEIEKHIPLLSGLGGGSSDAAAVIEALCRLYETPLKMEEKIKIALKCGADVPFFLYGGTARVGGIGEKVEPLPDITGYYALIIKSGEKVSTADMYRKVDANPKTELFTDKFIKNGNCNDAFKNTGNAFADFYKNDKLFTLLKSQNPICVSLSGSGPSLFAVFESETDANKAKEYMESNGFSPIVAPFVSSGFCVIE